MLDYSTIVTLHYVYFFFITDLIVFGSRSSILEPEQLTKGKLKGSYFEIITSTMF